MGCLVLAIAMLLVGWSSQWTINFWLHFAHVAKTVPYLPCCLFGLLPKPFATVLFGAFLFTLVFSLCV